jgi:membrane protease YdiL (CAAX protease family)
LKIIVTGFLDTTSKPQRIAGWIYLPLHIFVLPLFAAMYLRYAPNGGNELYLTVGYYALGFVFCLLVFWRYLRMGYDILWDNWAKNALAFFLAYVICMLLTYLAAVLIFLLLGDRAANPNNESVDSLVQQYPKAMMGLTVFLAPLLEETLFRGVCFGSLRMRHKTFAYLLSMLLFAFYHVWEYALAQGDAMALLYMLEYLPAGYALAWLYDKTNCIWMPVFLHMLINALATAVATMP